ncbi:MAG TPA: inositol monophosphatase [Myxococcota bacterium]
MGSQRAPAPPHEHALADLEAGALALAREAGGVIAGAFGKAVAVVYKDAQTAREGRPPAAAVSEVDRHVEELLRQRIAERFPGHGVIGEEIDTGAAEPEWLWVLDPVDGTTNFVNGLPIVASSIGLLWRGEPLVGAVWCASTHRLAPGTYHARRGGPLGFEGAPLEPLRNRDVLRRLAGLPGRDAGPRRSVDPRVLGSAASECAYVAAGLLRFSILHRASIWDVAGGVALVRAAGLPVLERTEAGWRPFERFTGEPLRRWRGTLVLGEPDELPER